MNWRWIVILTLMFLLAIFTVQNHEVVEVHFLLWSLEASRAIVIFGTLIIGIIIGLTSFYLWKRNE